MTAKIESVNVSRKKGTAKTPVGSVELRVDSGLVGDAHAAPGSRQVSLLAAEEVEETLGPMPANAGRYAENLTVRGLPPEAYEVGRRLRVGPNVVLEISQIGKECHTGCAVFRQVGDCIMPTRGVFARVVEGGTVSNGDAVEVIR